MFMHLFSALLGRSSNFAAVVSMPDPSGFVSTNTSSGLHEEFEISLPGFTVPVTDNPYIGISFFMV